MKKQYDSEGHVDSGRGMTRRGVQKGGKGSDKIRLDVREIMLHRKVHF